MTRLYLSGPITGIPEMNRPAFARAATTLRAHGYSVINPHEIGEPSEELLPWESYLRADLIVMLQHADGLALLPGWTRSRGAQLEHHVATALKWRTMPWNSWLLENPQPRTEENCSAYQV